MIMESTGGNSGVVLKGWIHLPLFSFSLHRLAVLDVDAGNAH